MNVEGGFPQQPTVRERISSSLDPNATLSVQEDIVKQEIYKRLNTVVTFIVGLNQKNESNLEVLRLLDFETDETRSEIIIADIIYNDQLFEMIARAQHRMMTLFSNSSLAPVGKARDALLQARKKHDPLQKRSVALGNAELQASMILKDFFGAMREYAEAFPFAQKILAFFKGGSPEALPALMQEIMQDEATLSFFAEVERVIASHSSFSFRPEIREMIELLEDIRLIYAKKSQDYEEESVAY